MKSTILFSVIFCLCIAVIDFPLVEGQACPADKDRDWSWDPNAPNGPSHWGDTYPDCKGQKQSPINIDPSSAEKKSNDGLPVTNYDKEIKKATIKNEGYLLTITPTDGVDRSVTYDGKTYNLREFHFHWGHKQGEYNSPGSEHSMTGRRNRKQKYAMELHLAHYDSDDNLVIVAGFLGEVFNHNPTMDKILKPFEKYQYMGDSAQVSYGENDTGINLQYIIQKEDPYYVYEGSNTFPPCKEGVTWMVSSHISGVNVVAIHQLEKLYTVKKGDANADKCHMVDIFRPIQPLNGRTVSKN